ncbi:MAG: hypothetical protein M1511_17945 [Deltaproteobacteria bacterium]|nr:hypothetical protein [Deltaproteobacteria bacterium]
MSLEINKPRLSRSSIPLIALCILFAIRLALCAESSDAQICKPELLDCPAIEIGNAGVFKWTCNHDQARGEGFYIVFIRPSGTYVLLKVPKGRTTFEFTPDVPGTWRWMVINTHPDRTKSDVESTPGYFQVVNADAAKH